MEFRATNLRIAMAKHIFLVVLQQHRKKIKGTLILFVCHLQPKLCHKNAINHNREHWGRGNGFCSD